MPAPAARRWPSRRRGGPRGRPPARGRTRGSRRRSAVRSRGRSPRDARRAHSRSLGDPTMITHRSWTSRQKAVVHPRKASGMERALITGATSGIGRAVAEQLAADGYDVVIHGRDPERGAAVAAGTGGAFIAADLTDADDVRRLTEQVGDVDVLVNNAGISVWGPTSAFDLAAY